MARDEAVIRQWSSSAPFWEKHRAIITQMFAPATDALVEDSQIGSGHTVLDVATGPGEPALSVAALVGPRGKVSGVDLIEEMVAAARRAAESRGLRNTEFQSASADHLPYPDDTFDAVISRFGVMFFPSPVDGVREMLRVLKPGRKMALAAWHLPETNPLFYTVARVIERFVEWPQPEPDAPDAFRFANPGKLKNVLTEAGVKDPVERLLRFNVQAPVSVEDFWKLRCEMSEKLREKIALLSSEQVAEAKRLGLEAIREYSTDGGMSFPAEVLIVSGSK